MAGTVETMPGLDSSLQEMPTTEWWHEADLSFLKLQQLLRPGWKTEAISKDDGEDATNARLVREGSLPDIIILPSGNHLLRLSATTDSLECIGFGTMGPKLFIDLFWEAIMQGDDSVIVHKVQIFMSRILLSIGSYEFELKYLHCETLVRDCPNILNAPTDFLDDPKNLSHNVRSIVYEMRSGIEVSSMSNDHRRAYHYIRAWGIVEGVFNLKDTSHAGKQFNSQDFVKICGRRHGDFSSLVTHFFNYLGISPDPANPNAKPSTEKEWVTTLLRVQNEPFHEKVARTEPISRAPCYIRVSLIYTGSSMAKGGDWLSMVNRKTVKLKERLEARVKDSFVRIWPQRLVSSKSSPDDSIYEGFIIVALSCADTDIPLASEVCSRWEVQVNEDTILKENCFISTTISTSSTMIEKDDLKACTRVWPKPVVKPEENRLNQDNDTIKKRKKAAKSSTTDSPARTGESTVKGAKLRPANEVLSRLHFDQAYNIDECVIGYKDRHMSKIMEKPAADWATDTTHEEFIPEHRIEYFKEDGDIIWDKSNKVDKVFNSGKGSD